VTGYGLPVGCVRCGGDTRIARHGVTTPHRVVAVVTCTHCAAEMCLRVELTPITPPPLEPNPRAQDYRRRMAVTSTVGSTTAHAADPGQTGRTTRTPPRCVNSRGHDQEGDS